MTLKHIQEYISQRQSLMKLEAQEIKVPKQLLTCKICSLIFFKPITLSCGHTFCKQCLRSRTLQKELSQNQIDNQTRTQKLSVCIQCQNIIWRQLSQMHLNLTIQNMVSKFYKEQWNQRQPQANSHNYTQDNGKTAKIPHDTSQIHNKILLRIKQPKIMPMPNCFSQSQFTTAFIDDIVDQSNSIIITWDAISKKDIGLLCKLTKVQPIDHQLITNKIVFDFRQSNKMFETKYKCNLQGLNFVKIQNLQQIQINLKNKFINLTQQKNLKITRKLQICNGRYLHSINSIPISIEHFATFFDIYDHLNNPHYLRQIRTLISDESFQVRTNVQQMLYCMLRLLKIPNELRKQLVLCFDNGQRLNRINQWLLEHPNRIVDEIFHIKIPGKYNTGIVFFIIFLMLAFHLFQDYSARQD